jgi:hypothetical protein
MLLVDVERVGEDLKPTTETQQRETRRRRAAGGQGARDAVVRT